MDAIEGNYLRRHALPVEPVSANRPPDWRARELRSAELLRVGNFRRIIACGKLRSFQVQIRGKIVAVNWKFIILATILIGVVVNVSDIVFCTADNLIAVGSQAR